MRRLVAVAAMVVMSASGCASDSATQRTVRVDFQHDEFASHYWRFFPHSTSARPGDTVVFRQEWTGEPHTVTMGSLVDGALQRVRRLEEKYADLPEDAPLVAEAEREFEEATKGLPILDPYRDADAQNAALPCYLRDGSPPADRDTPCPPARRRQPVFDGEHSFYSSGFIPPAGSGGNTFRIRLANDLRPGTYRYYCIIHFSFMQGDIQVRPRGAELPAQADVNEQAREEIDELASPLRRAYADAERGRAEYEGEPLRLPLAGYHSGEEFTVAIDEFVPRTITTRVNRPVTWTIVGAHTISFDVPRYIPIFFVSNDRTVRRNPAVDRAAGGSPRPPPVDFTSASVRLDGGTWDGDGFFSSGLIGSEPNSTYTLRVSEPGRYRYACLVHPKMVGTLIVEE